MVGRVSRVCLGSPRNVRLVCPHGTELISQHSQGSSCMEYWGRHHGGTAPREEGRQIINSEIHNSQYPLKEDLFEKIF